MKRSLKPVVPNSVTMLALAFGVSSLYMTLWGNWSLAVVFILLSCLFDFMDGKVARALGVSSRFGAELDSLSDFVCFGVAPGFLMYNWSMDTGTALQLHDTAQRTAATGMPWVCALFLAMCCAGRLARFNAMLDEKQPSYWLHFFTGVPAPAGGFLAMAPLIFWLALGDCGCLRTPWFAGIFVVFAGIMMASRLPTFCLKHLHMSKTVKTLVMIILLALVACCFGWPWHVASLIVALYLLSIPVSIGLFLKFRREAQGKK